MYRFLQKLVPFTHNSSRAQIQNAKSKIQNSFSSSPDSAFLIFSTGLTGMAFSLVLMFAYQARFGTLFLDVGLVSALFMLGAFLGGAAGRIMAGQRMRPGLLVSHAVFLLLVIFLPDTASRLAFILLFLASGFFTGVYFPIGAADYAAAGRSATSAGASLETFDTLGGAMGAALTGLVLLPMLGHNAILAGLAALVAVNLPPAFVRNRAPRRPAHWFDRAARPVGYWMAGIGVYALVVSNAIAAAVHAANGPSWLDAAREMAGADEIIQRKVQLQGVDFTWCEIPPEGDRPARYIFETSPWAGKVQAFAGPISLAVCIDAAGNFIDYRFLKSAETPSYQYIVESKKERLAGMNLFAPDPFKNVGTFSGATVTDLAVRRILEQAGRGFAEQVLHQSAAAQPVAAGSAGPMRKSGGRELTVLALLFAAAVGVRYAPTPWRRRLILALTFLMLGLWLNLQYSSQQVLSLLNLSSAFSATGAFFLFFCVPVLTVACGNVYCGYICPFGALQELMQTVTGGRFAIHPGKRVWRYTRSVKYILLFGLVIAFAVSRDMSAAQGDPLIMLFSGNAAKTVLVFAAAILALSVLFSRFWCRNLCPAGAFLSLLSGLRPVRKIFPPRMPARCDLGVPDIHAFDCIYCDRCRIARHWEESATKQSSPITRRADSLFVAAVIVALVLLAVTSLPATPPAPASSPETTAPQAAETSLVGKPRDADQQKIQSLIQRNQLSDHPADFQKSTP